jgi:glutathione synthase/RimK-type ligase-like ATP-grasp enzyme
MILVVGDPEDGPTAAVLRACRARRVPHALFDETVPGASRVDLSLEDAALDGRIHHDGWTLTLAEIRAVYLRPSGHSPAWRPLQPWTETTAVPVANRVSAMASNGSKPYQAQLIAPFFAVPHTVVTSDPDVVREFARTHGRVVYKSCSGVRSQVEELDEAGLDRLDTIRWCPTQFQERVVGTNVRVHVVGEDTVATAIGSAATDYRYAGLQVGVPAELEATELPSEVAARCVALTAALGLAVSGVDLMLTPDGRWVCFEVNPSPGFTFFEERTRQPIAETIVSYLLTAPRRAA